MKRGTRHSKAAGKPENTNSPGAHSAVEPVQPVSPGRKWLFRFVALSLPFIFLSVVEIAFRVVPALDEDRDPYVNISPVSVFSRTMIAGQEYYNITHKFVIGGGGVHILVKKPADTIRIFCLGGSACAGWPHPTEETFSASLQQALETAYPGKKIEVINAAAHGFAAYRVRHILDEVLKMDPDAVLIWSGNNEFLEDRNYDPPSAGIVSVLRHLRIVQWLQSRFASRNELSGGELKDMAQVFWKKTRQQSLRLRSDPVQFAQVQEHFRISFNHMVSQCQRYHVPIVLCTVPVNLRDWLPTVSHDRLSGEQRQQWRKLYYGARRCLIEGNNREGIQLMRQAIAMENEHAESYFWLGRLLEADGQKTSAWEAFSEARDLDYNPFRAISSFNESIRNLALENIQQGVYLLDLDRLFAANSRSAAPGFDLFLDYVHPTRPANLLVAQSAFDLITQDGVLKSKPAVDQFIYHDVYVGPNGKPYQDETDLNLQRSRLTMATEGRQYETVLRETEELMQQMTGHHLSGPDDPLLERYDPQSVERYRVFWSYLDVQRRVIMGLLADETELQEAKRHVDDFYEKWYPRGTF